MGAVTAVRYELAHNAIVAAVEKVAFMNGSLYNRGLVAKLAHRVASLRLIAENL